MFSKYEVFTEKKIINVFTYLMRLQNYILIGQYVIIDDVIICFVDT